MIQHFCTSDLVICNLVFLFKYTYCMYDCQLILLTRMSAACCCSTLVAAIMSAKLLLKALKKYHNLGHTQIKIY